MQTLKRIFRRKESTPEPTHFIKDYEFNYFGPISMKETKGNITITFLKGDKTGKTATLTKNQWKSMEQMTINQARGYGMIKGGKRQTRKMKRPMKRKQTYRRYR